jgi:hypothetical protein
LYNILMEFWIPMKLGTLNKSYLNKTYNTVRIVKHLSDTFPIQNGLSKEMFYCHSFSTLV